MNITAVIMCSGLGRRMGKNKLLMPFRGKRLFEYTADAVSEMDFYKRIAVTAYEEIALYCKNMTVIFNPDNEEGVSSSIRLGAENSGDCDGIMFFTADQPFLDTKAINRLISAFEGEGKITVPFCNGRPGNPVIFPVKYKNDLLELRGDEGGKKIYKAAGSDMLPVVFDDEILFSDIDTYGDLKKLS